MLDAARQQIRQGFRDKASLSASDPAVQPAIQHAEEVASFLKSNLVQGRREADGVYSKQISPPFGVGAPFYSKPVADRDLSRAPHPRTHRTGR